MSFSSTSAHISLPAMSMTCNVKIKYFHNCKLITANLSEMHNWQALIRRQSNSFDVLKQKVCIIIWEERPCNIAFFCCTPLNNVFFSFVLQVYPFSFPITTTIKNQSYCITKKRLHWYLGQKRLNYLLFPDTVFVHNQNDELSLSNNPQFTCYRMT